jgi:hypothetical protein
LYLGAPQKIQEKIIYNPYLHIELKLGIFGVARKLVKDAIYTHPKIN